MADYYITQNNSTYFLSGSKIYFTEGSGSVDKTDSTEMTFDWFLNQQDITIVEVLEISDLVSGSKTYMGDNGWI